MGGCGEAAGSQGRGHRGRERGAGHALGLRLAHTEAQTLLLCQQLSCQALGLLSLLLFSICS